jgi:hypothetical protein
LDNLRHYPKDVRRGGLGKSGGDLRRPIYEATEPIEKGGWDKMPGQEKADGTVASACAEGLKLLIEK